VVGRRTELRLRLSAIGRDRAILLLGLPGVSKTTMLRALARHLGAGAHFAFIEIALGLYVLVLAGFWAVTHGRINARPVGLACLLAVVGTLYIMIYGGGLLAPPGA
jgi:hypothetical protein